jgi:hypothetical protein
MPNDEVPLVHAFRAAFCEEEEKLVIVTCPFCGKHHVHDVPSAFREAIQHQPSPCSMRPYNFVWHAGKSITQAAIDILRVRDEEPERLTRDPEAMHLLCAVLDEVSRMDDQPGGGGRQDKGWRHADGHYPKIPPAVLALLKTYRWALPVGHDLFVFLQDFRCIGDPVGAFTYRPTVDPCLRGGVMTYAELERLAREEPFRSFVLREKDTLYFNEDAQAALEAFCHAVYGAWATCCDRLEWRRNPRTKCVDPIRKSRTV